MQVLLTRAIKEALERIGHVPDSLRARFDAMAQDGDAFALTLSDDDATALAELMQWHIKTDPATGEVTAGTRPYQDLIRLLDEAMFA